MPPKAKPRPCSRCGNQRPIYDHSAHHCEYCFQLLTNRDQNRLEELEAENKRLLSQIERAQKAVVDEWRTVENHRAGHDEPCAVKCLADALTCVKRILEEPDART